MRNANCNSKAGAIMKDGFQLNYLIEGQGVPTLVIGSSVFYPRTFSQELRDHLQLVFVDHRGFTNADHAQSDEICEMDTVMSDLESVRAHLGLEKVVIMGHSAHGYLALEYARRYPEKAVQVVVIATGPSHGWHMQLAEQQWNESVCPERKEKYEKDMALLSADLERDPANRFIYFCRRMSARSWYDLSFDPGDLWKDVPVHMPTIDHLFGAVFRDLDIASIVRDISQPVLMVMGRFDYQVAPYWSWGPYRPLIKDLTFRVFDQSAHYPQYEESTLFNQQLLSWLKSKRNG